MNFRVRIFVRRISSDSAKGTNIFRWRSHLIRPEKFGRKHEGRSGFAQRTAQWHSEWYQPFIITTLATIMASQDITQSWLLLPNYTTYHLTCSTKMHFFPFHISWQLWLHLPASSYHRVKKIDFAQIIILLCFSSALHLVSPLLEIDGNVS